MRVVVEETTTLSFADGSPVRAASAIAPFGGGWLVVQDDATHAAWVRPAGITPVRVIDAVDGLEVFSEAAGTKHLKPDFEAACAIGDAALLLGSGSSPARMRASLVRLGAGESSSFTAADLSLIYRDVAAAMGLTDQLNLEGACVIGNRLRWFQRANRAAGAPTVSVDVDLAALLATVEGREREVAVGNLRHYELGEVGGVTLGVTDAVAAGDGLVLVSAVAEDTSNAIDDGPVAGAALMLLDDEGVRDEGLLNAKVEGLAFAGSRLLAVVDADDPAAPSQQLTLKVTY
ncbi:DUF6929 family protein [Actinoplanes sp. CA-142083]|uniref:DUF6929 family protein n=1 Tax=Actinoplanes sp. CA-142083 TaxID=3239903 RepID=UPI003D93AC26